MDYLGYPSKSSFSSIRVSGESDLDGDVVIGGDLDVKGSITYTSLDADFFEAKDGTAPACGYRFQSDHGTGMYRDTGTGDLMFARGGTPQVRFSSGQTDFLATTVSTFETQAAVQMRTPDLRLTGSSVNTIESDTDMLIYTLGDNIKIQNNSIPTIDLNPSEMQVHVPIKDDFQVQGSYFTFADDADNSKLWFDTGDTKVKMQVHGDPSCEFYAKTIQGTYCIMDSSTTGSLTCTNASITNVTATTTTTSDLSCTTALTSTLTCTSQPITEFRTSATQSVANNNVTIRLIVNATPTYTRGAALYNVSFSTVSNYFQVPFDGYWQVQWVIMWFFQTGGYRQSALIPYPAGTPFYDIDKRLPITTAGEYTVTKGSYTAYMTGGTQWQIMVYQNSGAAVNIATDTAFPTYVRWTRLY